MAAPTRIITTVFFCLLTAIHASTPGIPTEWLGSNIPSDMTSVEMVADSPASTYYVGGDGKLRGVGFGGETQYDIAGIKAIVAGMERDCGFALLQDGSVVGFGDLADNSGLPGAPGGIDLTPPADLHDVVSLSVGSSFAVAAKRDGTIQGWPFLGGLMQPPADLTNVTRVACGIGHIVALRQDGAVTAWGQNIYGESVIPKNLSNVVDIAAGGFYTIALLGDGTVRVFGDPAVQPAAPVTDVKSIAAGFDFWVALKNDGSVESFPPIDFRGLKRVTRVYAGMRHIICWTVAPMIWDDPTNIVSAPGGELTLSVRAVSATPLSYQWLFEGNPIPGATNATYQFPATEANSGGYSVHLENADDVAHSKTALVVIGKPAVQLSSSTLSAREGSSVTFNATSISPSSVTYHWLFGTTELATSADGSLTLDNLQVSQAGTYSVRAENEFGSTFSNPIQLAIQPLLSPSTNDNFADSIRAETFPYALNGNIRFATREPGEPADSPATGPNTLWWSFKPVQTGVLTVGIGTLTGGRLQLYRGSELQNLQLVPSDGAHFLVEAGVEYRLQLSTTELTPEDFGEFSLSTDFEQTGANDNFEMSTHLEDESATVHAWLVTPSLEQNEPLPGTNVLGTLWWSWAAPTNGRVEILPQATLAIYTGPTLDRLTRTPVVGSYPIVFSAKAGEIYHIQLCSGALAGLESTTFNLNFTPYTQAINDNFADAAPLDGLPKSNIGATRETGEPAHRDGGPNKSLWWKVTAGYNAELSSIRNGNGTLTNATIGVYQGGSVDTLQLVAKGAGRVDFNTWAGETYYIAAETPASDDGDIVLGFFPGKPTALARPIPGNIVQNPSFEDITSPAWTGQAGGVIDELGPDGKNYAILNAGYLQQDINTTTGQVYQLRFVYAGPQLIVEFGGVEIVPTTISPPIGGWQTAEYVVTATSTVSRLFFRGPGPGTSFDQVSLVAIDRPPEIITQPENATVFEGQSAQFHVGVTGAEPLWKQWYLNGAPINGATGNTLTIDSVTKTNAGVYFVVATNAFGRIESHHVTLAAEDAASPQIILQPQGDKVYVGQYFVLQAAAIGTPPLEFQWYRNGSEMPSETNSSLIFNAFKADQVGQYAVRVTHAAQSALSLPAALSLAEDPEEGGGLIWFANVWSSSPQIPIYDVDGATRIAGTNFVAQLYAGPNGDLLRPVGAPRPFQTGFKYGLWIPQSIALPNISPGQEVFVQARVWEVSAGASYEVARATGGKFGRSEVLRLVAGQNLFPPLPEEGTPLLGLQTFQLHAGLPDFVTGDLTLLEIQSDGNMIWQLTGAPGFRYLIERQTNSGQWLPFTTVVNENGVTTFTDTADADAQIQLYRARILD